MPRMTSSAVARLDTRECARSATWRALLYSDPGNLAAKERNMSLTPVSRARAVLSRAAFLACVAALAATAAHAQLKSYDSTKKDFWAKPPPDWFLGDETEAQKG